MKKNNIIQIRITDAEKEKIQEKAKLNDMSVSDFMRYCSLNANKIILSVEVK